jgi:2-desacetyl-2-hydroxyethyl bacteriochlorophyllide A dehydrogenase
MRAIRYHGQKDIRLDDIPTPSPKPHEVLIAPAYCGICGTDLDEYLHGPQEYPATPHPLTGESVPLTLGHEFSGVVVDIGSTTKTLKPGDRVVVHGILSCGKCEACLTGNENACVIAANVGQHGAGGGLAERMVRDEAWCYKIPDRIGLDVAALCEPLAVSEHAINQLPSPPRPDQTALVLGCGAIGLGVIQLLRARGLTKIYASEISSTRRKSAISFGASQAFNPKETDVVETLRQLTGGTGPHIVFECAGVPASIQTALNAVRTHGTIIVVALQPPQYSIDSNPILHKELTVRGSLSHKREDYANVLRMLDEGSLKPESMITNVVSLARTVADGIMALSRGDEGLIKVLVEVNSEEKIRKLLNENEQ